MKYQVSKNFVCVAVLSTLFLAAPTLCEDEEAALTNNSTKSSGHINSPGFDRIKLLTSGKLNAGGQRKPVGLDSDSTSKTSGGDDPETKNKSANLTSIFDNKESSDEIHVGGKQVKSRSNSSSAEAGFVPSNHFLFADQRPENPQGTPALSKRNSSSSSLYFEHVEKHQLHQSLGDDSDESFLRPPLPIRKQNPQPHVGDSVIVHSDSVPVRTLPSTNAQLDNRGNPTRIGIRKPIPMIRQETEQKVAASANAGDE